MTQTGLTLSIDALRKVAGYAHWISVLKGFHQSYLTQEYPGWDWNQIIPQLIKEKVVEVNSMSSSSLYLANGLSICLDVTSVTITISDKGISTKITKTNSTSKVRKY